MPLPISISSPSRLGTAFLVLLAVWIVLSAFGVVPWLATLLAVAVFATGAVLFCRMCKFLVKQSLWRLRNRLLLNYVLIGVIPVMLILIWVTLGGYFLAGQVAVFLISAELDRRVQELNEPAHILSWSNTENRVRTMNQMMPFVRNRFPHVEVFVHGPDEYRYPAAATINPPPVGWRDCAGLVTRNGHYYTWAHVAQPMAEVVMMEPITNLTLSELIPNLGAVRFLGGVGSGEQKTVHVPSPQYWLDPEVTWVAQLSVAHWDRPNHSVRQLITVTTRPSAVMSQIFGKDFDIAQDSLIGLMGIAFLFFLVELLSLVTGISLTRTITGAVHNLYEGTRKVTAGDFQHRIEVRGNDQLAELSKSFNSMTENLERLFAVEKEKERLQSELEIAKGVQFQLFPKDVPTLTNMQLKGVCQPARMVSGDYYDYLCLDKHRVAFAIGDVAGKGISAALLMASIQSIMRTQLAASDVSSETMFSTSRAVFQLNNQLYANTSLEKFATFYFAVYDETQHMLTYTNAGHLPPILLRNNRAESLEVTGTVVGAFPKMQFEERTIALQSGDLLAAYTDGIAEPENEYGEEFGVERLTDLLLRHQHADTGELIARIMEAVQQWTNAPELPDDMTLLIARIQ